MAGRGNSTQRLLVRDSALATQLPTSVGRDLDISITPEKSASLSICDSWPQPFRPYSHERL